MNSFTGHYDNPVVRGHAPDPSAIRVGNDYFLANSSFGMLPGIPIRQSTDLVHWRTIGFAVTRPSQYRRDGQPGRIVLFAPTLRYHDGTFYLVTTNAVDQQGNFMVSTNDPTGEWSDAVWLDNESFDPSLFRDDDGTWYYTRRDLRFRPDGNLGPIVSTTVDLRSGQLGEFVELTPGNRGFASNDIEGPHLYKRDGWYYLCAAEGSSWKGHMQTIGRSRSPEGPFDPAPNNPILTHRDRTGHPFQTIGHAELVEAADGHWWALSLGTRHAPLSQHHNLGRETFLTPVQWNEDGWPVVGEAGTTEVSYESVPLPAGEPTHYDVADTLWTRGWTTLGAPPAELDPATGSGGEPIEVAFGRDPAEGGTGPFGALFKAQSEDQQTFAATLPTPPPDHAVGVAVYTDTRHHYCALLRVEPDGRWLEFRRMVDDLLAVDRIPVAGSAPIRLSISATPGAYTFRADVAGNSIDVGAGSARLLSAEAAEWFVNANFTLLAIGSEGGVGAFENVVVETPEVPDTVPIVLPF